MPATSPSLGEFLRHARERRGFTLEGLARETKIPQRHLEALERDNLSAIPAAFYQRAEVRAYARAVGLDQGVTLARLESSRPVVVRTTGAGSGATGAMSVAASSARAAQASARLNASAALTAAPSAA